MKIAIDITQAQYQGTGVGNYTYNLVKHLLKLDQDNQYLLYGGSFRDYFKLKSIATELGAPHKIYPLANTISNLLFNQIHSIPIELFTGQVDIFHASDWTHPKAKRAKTITTIHDLTTLKFPQHQHSKTIATHQRRLEHVKQEAAAIIADSQATKNDIVKLLQIPAEKIHVVHLAVSDDFTAFANLSSKEKTRRVKSVRSKYDLNENYLLSVGTNEPRKNLKRTIEAFNLFSSSNNNKHQLAIAGKFGWGKLKIEPRHTNPDLPAGKAGIRALGFVDQSDLPALYTGASAFIYPSLYEGFGFPILEAMTLGIPVVTTNKGSLKEVAGQAAVLVNPTSTKDIAAGIQSALNQFSKYQKLGLTQAKKFSWTKTAQQTLNVYEKAHKQTSRGS